MNLHLVNLCGILYYIKYKEVIRMKIRISKKELKKIIKSKLSKKGIQEAREDIKNGNTTKIDYILENILDEVILEYLTELTTENECSFKNITDSDLYLSEREKLIKKSINIIMNMYEGGTL